MLKELFSNPKALLWAVILHLGVIVLLVFSFQMTPEPSSDQVATPVNIISPEGVLPRNSEIPRQENIATSDLSVPPKSIEQTEKLAAQELAEAQQLEQEKAQRLEMEEEARKAAEVAAEKIRQEALQKERLQQEEIEKKAEEQKRLQEQQKKAGEAAKLQREKELKEKAAKEKARKELAQKERERKAAEDKASKEKERKKAEERARKEKQKKAAEEKARKERKEKAAKEKAERERKEAARKAAEEKKKQEAAARKQAEEEAAIAREEKRRIDEAKRRAAREDAARRGQAIRADRAAWSKRVQRHVKRNWNKPSDTFGMYGKMKVRIKSSGYVERIVSVTCPPPNSRAFCDSMKRALERANPLPRPRNPDAFLETIELEFEPTS